MSKEELFSKYGVSAGHNRWDNTVDNWFSVEIFRETHNGDMSKTDDIDPLYVLDFLDKTKDAKYFFGLTNPGSMFTTAHRMVYRYADQILEALNNPTPQTNLKEK